MWSPNSSIARCMVPVARGRCVIYAWVHVHVASWCISVHVSEGHCCNDVGAQRGAETKNSPIILVVFILGLLGGQVDRRTDTCTENGKVYANNEVWNQAPCRTCVCDKGTLLCEDLICEDTSHCKSVEIPVGECCPVCSTSDTATTPITEAAAADTNPAEDCTVDGTVRRHHDVWKPEPCRVCVCESGVAICEELACEAVGNCAKVVIPDGECCPVCDGFSSARRTIEMMAFKGQKGEPGDIPYVVGTPGRLGPMGPQGAQGVKGRSGELRGLKVSMESQVSREIPDKQDPPASLHTPGAPAALRAFQERPENQGPWVSVDIEDLMGLQGSLEQIGWSGRNDRSTGISRINGRQRFPRSPWSPWVERVVLVSWAREENLEHWGQRVRLVPLVEWVFKVLWVPRACKEREAGWDQQDLWENVVHPVTLGPMGITGMPGFPGNPGMKGQPGPTGSRGSEGPQGPRGDGGRAGPPGPSGNQGTSGQDGTPGSRGTTGLAGVQGPVGLPGPVGPPGPQGTTGVPGPKGQLGDGGLLGFKGETGLKGELGDPGAHGGLGPMGEEGKRGPRGDAGSVGTAGPQGEAGAPGNRGFPGADGLAGQKGALGERGGPGFTGAKGSDGDEGRTGEPGLPGARGLSGLAGMQGSEGKPGPMGGPGEDGKPGPAGPAGTRGAAGPMGGLGPKGFAVSDALTVTRTS
ncbi:Collagen alpha-2(V) chain [Merluccius polli]|uniref:Collagen alpha-2(V) chain n=1 Tax=Merluccius polli TaxID=89951 RepID=A0AA47MF65_MERPO|nr:Collagen alpha-2(V) chain [Merluccius polli]